MTRTAGMLTAMSMPKVPTVRLVDHVQRPKHFAAVQRIAHEIECPHHVHPRHHNQRLTLPLGRPPLRASRQIELHAAIHPVHSLVIPRVSEISHPVIALPEPPARPLRQRGIERSDDRRIACGLIRSRLVVRRPRQPDFPPA